MSEKPAPGSAFLESAGSSLWHFFISVRLAVALILVLTGLSLVGALLVQVPAGYVNDPVKYASWLEQVAYPRYGALANILAALQLFDVFHSLWFIGAGSLLIVNISVCSLTRFRIRRRAGESPVRMVEEFYLKAAKGSSETVAGIQPQDAAKKLTEILSRRGYRIRFEEGQGRFHLFADKNRFSEYGTFLTHLSIIILIAGFLVGSYFGFRDDYFIVAEGETREVGYAGIALKLNSFTDEYYTDGTPRDYRSDVVVYQEGSEVKSGIVRVNHPLGYEGVRIYQSFYGKTSRIRVEEGEKIIFQGVVSLSGIIGADFKRPVGFLSIPDKNLTAYIVGSAKNLESDPMIPQGTFALELYEDASHTPLTLVRLETSVPQEVSGLKFTVLEEGQFSGFQVSYDPGVSLIWIASALFLMGVVLVFYLPHLEVRAMVSEEAVNTSRIAVSLAPPRGFASDFEIRSISREVGRMNREGSRKR